MKLSKSFLIKSIKHKINIIKETLAKGFKSLRSYVLDLLDLETKLENLMEKPALQGTEKQLSWANEIQDRVFYILENVEELRFNEAIERVIKNCGAMFTVEEIINPNLFYEKSVAQHGKEKTDLYYAGYLQTMQEIKLEAFQDKEKISVTPRHLEGLKNLPKLEKISEASLWIELFKDIKDVSWASYKSILAILRGSFMNKLQ